MKISVACATYNRAELLDRALYTYSKQTMPTDEWEYLLVDDLSQDDTLEVCQRWIDAGLPLRVFDSAKDLKLPKQPGQWRDGCKLRNAASTYAVGEVIVSTHPEIMIPPDALQVMYDSVTSSDPLTWHTAIPYWLPEGQLPSWKRDIWRLREMEGFYDPSWPSPVRSPGAIDYRNQNQERRSTWESEVWWGMRSTTWRWLGGFREFEQWGSVDMDMLQRRSAAGVKTVIVKDPHGKAPSGNLMVYHQWHTSKRDMDLALEGVKGTAYAGPTTVRDSGGLWRRYNDTPLVDRVRLVLESPRHYLVQKNYVQCLIRAFGLKGDVLAPYGPDNQYMVAGGGLWQYPSQLAEYLVWLSDKDIRTYVEVGSGDGHLLVLMTAYLKTANPNFQKAVGVDPNVGFARKLIATLDLPIELVEGTSDLLAGQEPFDLAFIDGEHTYHWTMHDWQNVGSKAKLCAIHDIDATVLPEVRRAWQKISSGQRTVRFTGPAGVMGIGVVTR